MISADLEPDTPSSILSVPDNLWDKLLGLSSATILPSDITKTRGHIAETSGRICEEINKVCSLITGV